MFISKFPLHSLNILSNVSLSFRVSSLSILTLNRCPYKDANGYDQKYVVILNENDPIYSTTRHLHIKKAREWIVANVKTFTEQSKALVWHKDI